MRRFALALSLSLALHAGLLALSCARARSGEIESAQSEVMRVSLAVTPRAPENKGSVPAAPAMDKKAPEPKAEAEAKPQPQSAQTEERAAPPARQVKKQPSAQPQPQSKPQQKAKQSEPVRRPAPQKTKAAQTSNQTAERREPVPAQAAPARRGGAVAPASVPAPGGTGGASGKRAGAASGAPAVVDASRLKVVKKIPAEYPMLSRRRKDQGTVVLILSIRSGRVTKAEVEKSSGHAILDESAKKAVSAWEFDTSEFGDSLSARISFVFSLQGGNR